MTISVFELYSIGVGPSSSHTVGPMRAAYLFLEEAITHTLLDEAGGIHVDLYGSLALTGKGHGTDKAVLLGLKGERPELIDSEAIESMLAEIRLSERIPLMGEVTVPFQEKKHLIFHRDKRLPFHSNAMRFTLMDVKGKKLLERIYYSIGGGFVVDHETACKDRLSDEVEDLPYPFATAERMTHLAESNGWSILELMMANERSMRSDDEIRAGMLKIWHVMQACVERGCRQEGILPGGLGVKRRAPNLYRKLKKREEEGIQDPAEVMDWVSLWALAVNEENAAGGQVVTAPTNGAAGIIPAVLHYYMKYCPGANEEGVVAFMLVAGAIGILYREGASISAAEVGCQGEVGVACSMAAAGLTAVLGGNSSQIENAAEIGMEHNLGLTCDPVGGLVQVPCIERNTMGSIKAINASRLALAGDGSHRVSLDQVIRTMRETGKDMRSIYKETSEGGLAVNVPEC